MIKYDSAHITYDCPDAPCNPEQYLLAMEEKISFDAKIKLTKHILMLVK